MDTITTFTSDNIRFLHTEGTMLYGEELQPGTEIDKVCGDLEVDFGIGDNFEVNLLSDVQLNNYIDNIKEKSVNKIIDYERQQFVPMAYKGTVSIGGKNGKDSKNADEFFKNNLSIIDDNLIPITKIKFHLNFREKEYTVNYDENFNNCGDNEACKNKCVDSVDFGSWVTSDYGYWNNYTVDGNSDLTKLVAVYDGKNVYGDLLGYLGFTDDDVYYQKDALKKSFLRLSFYDSPNRETQKLLYYSTIHFDSNELSKNYILDLDIWRQNTGHTPTYNQLVFDGDIATLSGKTLTAEMACTDKYDDTLSSDGFYIHLFDKLISGNTFTPIYMKAEFNNAKFGKTVPMIYPTFTDTNMPISPLDKKGRFPRQYVRYKNNVSGDTYTYVDMESLLRDMYIKIFIKYDFKTHEYVWFLPTRVNGSVLKLELFEPRINGYSFESYYPSTSEGDTFVNYGTEDGQPKWFTGDFYKEGADTYTWYLTDGDNMYSEFGSEHTQQWPGNKDCTFLMTTAITLASDNKFIGTKLFNGSSLNNVKSIWIDGMMVYSSDYYDEEHEKYKTSTMQLPDTPFKATYTDGGEEEKYFIWNPETTQEVWDDETEQWINDPTVTAKVIHRVDYYFKSNTGSTDELLDELSSGVYHKDTDKRVTKTIEADSELVDRLKNEIRNPNGEVLPRSMFSGIGSLKAVNFKKRRFGTRDYYFTTVGNGAFNNCQNLCRVTVDDGSVDIISKNCFSGGRALKVANLSDVKVILREAFQGCYTLTKTNYKLGSGAKTRYIACGAFGYTKLGSVNIPKTVWRLSNSAFRRCYKLHEFVIENNSELESVGKRLFAENAILKYSLTRVSSTSSKYIYNGGIPQIILDLQNKNVNIEFYDNRNKRYQNLQINVDKDSGKVLKHYKNEKYLKYLTHEPGGRFTFEDWYRYLF